jgi:hypothetical protein
MPAAPNGTPVASNAEGDEQDTTREESFLPESFLFLDARNLGAMGVSEGTPQWNSAI